VAALRSPPSDVLTPREHSGARTVAYADDMDSETRDRPGYPVRSKALLEQWLADYLATGPRTSSSFKVAVQDESLGKDTGLVIMVPFGTPAEVYMQPAGPDRAEWVITLTGRDEDLTVSAQQLAGFAAELRVASDLCAYLQFRSIEWDRMSGMG